MMEGDPEVLLFDLGGVLVRWAGIESFVELSPAPLDVETVRRYWLESPLFRRFETGGATVEEFASSIIDDFDLSLSPAEFIETWTSWIREPLPGAHELLDKLRPRFRLACLSNTNELHWRRIRDELGFGGRFERAFISYELGHMKPDEAIYRLVLSELGCAPECVVFFDDNPECVEGARRVGMEAYLVKGVEAVRKALAGKGIEV